MENNISYVMDQDGIDTPIENYPCILYDGNRAGNSNEIDIGEINVNVLDTCAAVSVGENDLNAWSAHSKRNAGQGRFAGDIQNTQNSSLILDSDVIDSEMNDYG
ncbi:spore germination protein [Bacillus sp. FJAT-27251]|uniref:spore germination protein n=1 Tax=Bacillus sp. FJAT-27251 TaxID=1684142 RepID=UPI0018D0D8D3|nr:spore germination protein [Bacillus sp. FJAT-27251]